MSLYPGSTDIPMTRFLTCFCKERMSHSVAEENEYYVCEKLIINPFVVGLLAF